MVAAVVCRLSERVERVRQQFEEHRAEQRADGVADQHRHLRRAGA